MCVCGVLLLVFFCHLLLLFISLLMVSVISVVLWKVINKTINNRSHEV